MYIHRLGLTLTGNRYVRIEWVALLLGIEAATLPAQLLWLQQQGECRACGPDKLSRRIQSWKLRRTRALSERARGGERKTHDPIGSGTPETKRGLAAPYAYKVNFGTLHLVSVCGVSSAN